MTANACTDSSVQAATTLEDVAPNFENLPDILFQSFQSNLSSCIIHDLSSQKFLYDKNISHLIIHLNISSLQAHFDELNEFLLNFSSPPSLILISETRINVEPKVNIDLPGYTFFHFPSPTKAGGVGAYFLNNLNFMKKDNFGLNVQGCEDLWFDVKFPGSTNNFTIAVIYRHPHNNLSDFLNALDDKMNFLNTLKNNKAFIIGDINLDLNADNITSSGSDYLKMLQSHAFFPIITKPTRVSASSQTIIDHILTNDTESTITPGVFPYKISDHYPIFCTITNSIFSNYHSEVPYSYRNVNSVDGDKFRSDLESSLNPLLLDITHSPPTSQNKLDESFTRLVEIISKVIDKHAPLISVSRKQKRWQKKPWLTKGLIISIKNKQRLYKTYFLTGNEFEKSFYKKYSNKLTRVKNLSKKHYYKNALSQRKNNPKELWKFIKSVIPSKATTSSPSKLLVNGIFVEDPFEISHQFNKYFTEVGESIAKNVADISTNKKDYTKYLKNSVSNSIFLDPPQPMEIFNTINSLNLNKACGHDNISPYFLRLGNEVLAPILSQLLVHVFDLGYFPQIFKTAKVVPVFKTGSKDLVNNYRPISLLPHLSKVLEKLIKSRFLKFLDKHNVLYNYQYGFRNKHSVVHSLLDVTSLSYDSIQNKNYTALLLMDFRKAFDTVSHKILLNKLYHYGIRGPAHKLMESYLSERKQYVIIKNSSSSTRSINIGVPQGSILGPLLYLIYVNDITNATSCNPRLFADDTCLVLNNSSLSILELNCNIELKNLKNWCDANKLQINPQKSAVIVIPPKLNSPSVNIQLMYNNSLIPCNNSFKYLGVILDSKLNFKSHIDITASKISRAVGILSKLRYIFPMSSLVLLYYALVHPHLLFGLPVWGSTFTTSLNKLQTLQNKAIRIITNSDIRTPITPKYYELGILKLSDLYTYEIAKLMHQHSRHTLPLPLSSLFNKTSTIHSRHTRTNALNNLYPPKYSTNRCQNSFRYQGTKIWNSISVELRNQSFSKFKNNFKYSLLKRYF